ncbi:MAG: magnesium/cobalt transporter CorA, partial [Ardenticatenaceae bacterium]
MIRVTACMPDRSWQSEIDLERISDLIASENTLVWVEIQEPQEQAYDLLREEFEFHPLAIEDVQHGHNRPKIDVYDHYYFLVLYCADYDADRDGLQLSELELFIGPNYVVTIHDRAIAEVEATREQWERNVEALGANVGALVYTLVDRIVDDYFPVIDAIAERIETLEGMIFERFSPQVLEEIFQMKKELLAMRRVVAPERDVFNVLLRRDAAILPTDALPYFQDIYDHTIRVTDSLDTYRDLLSGALDAFLSVQGNHLNETIHRLTIISMIFLPLTVLTGFFGMNFQGIPFESN